MFRKYLLFSLIALTISACGKSDTEKVIDDEVKKVEVPSTKQEENENNSSEKGQENTSTENNQNPPATTGSENNNQQKLFVKKPLLENITGDWCYNCPRASDGIKQVQNNENFKNKVACVAIHTGGRWNTDHMEVKSITEKLLPYMKLRPSHNYSGGVPYCTVNRWNIFYPNNVTEFFSRIEENPTSDIGIKIESELNATGGDVSVKFKFNKDYEGLKYSIFITESNYTNYQESRGSNYVHNNILVAASGEVTGNDLGSVKAGNEVSKTGQVSYKLHTNNISNVNVIVFVANSDGLVLNSQFTKANVTKEYEYAN